MAGTEMFFSVSCPALAGGSVETITITSSSRNLLTLGNNIVTRNTTWGVIVVYTRYYSNEQSYKETNEVSNFQTTVEVHLLDFHNK